MDHELYRGLIIGLTGCLICFLFAYFGKKSIDKTGGALALGFLLFGYFTFHSFNLLYFYDIAIGTTHGTYRAGKSGYNIAYSFLYKNKIYKSGASMNYGAKAENGYYYVRLSKQFPNLNEIDFSSPVKDKKKLDSLHFIEFENLIIERDYIPRTMVAERVNLYDSQLYYEKSKYFGKTITYRKKYKLVHLRQSDGLRGHEILVTFDNLNRQIDVKTLLYYCTSCEKDELLAYLFFSDSSDEFTVKYFRPENPKVLPEEVGIKTLKEEEWIIDEKGFFVLK